MTDLWTSDEIAQATGGQSSAPFTCNGVAFDSREIGPNDLVFAMKGEQADGHRFVENAFASGAAGAVVSEPVAHPHILVPDSFHALEQLGMASRQRVDAKIIGVTGSAGKTGTKEALFAARTEDAVRRKARTGKTVRMLKSELSEAWEKPGAPEYLPTPLQGILYNEAHARVVRAKRRELYSFPAGQVVGMLDEETTVRDVMVRLQTEYLDAMERLRKLDPSTD